MLYLSNSSARRVITNILVGFCCFSFGRFFGSTIIYQKINHSDSNPTLNHDGACPSCPYCQPCERCKYNYQYLHRMSPSGESSTRTGSSDEEESKAEEEEDSSDEDGEGSDDQEETEDEDSTDDDEDEEESDEESSSSSTDEESEELEALFFPDSLKDFFVDYSAVPRGDFNQLLEIGVPLTELQQSIEDVLILYPGRDSLPNLHSRTSKNITAAVENCDSFKVILHEAKPRNNQCLIFMPQWESYHVHKFMRLPQDLKSFQSKDLPLRYVSRALGPKGKAAGVPFLNEHILPFRKTLVDYLSHLDETLEELKPQLLSMMHHSHYNDTVIVLVSNYGQSVLLHLIPSCNKMFPIVPTNSCRFVGFCLQEHEYIRTKEFSKERGILSYSVCYTHFVSALPMIKIKY